MLQSPDETSKQKTVCFSLNSKIATGTRVSLNDESGNEVIRFEVKEDFKTLIVSSKKITTGTYYLYLEGEKTNYTATVK